MKTHGLSTKRVYSGSGTEGPSRDHFHAFAKLELCKDSMESELAFHPGWKFREASEILKGKIESGENRKGTARAQAEL